MISLGEETEGAPEERMVPSAYWRFTIVVPLRDEFGVTLTRAQGLTRARHVTTVVPNVQSADLLLMDWAKLKYIGRKN